MSLIREFAGLFAEVLHSNREYLWYRQNQPCRYLPYRDPNCPINWIGGIPHQIFSPNPAHHSGCPCNIDGGRR
jgi:hypothetical protein